MWLNAQAQEASITKEQINYGFTMLPTFRQVAMSDLGICNKYYVEDVHHSNSL